VEETIIVIILNQIIKFYSQNLIIFDKAMSRNRLSKVKICNIVAYYDCNVLYLSIYFVYI